MDSENHLLPKPLEEEMGRGGIKEREKKEKLQREKQVMATGSQGNLARKPRRMVINEREEPTNNEQASKGVTTVLPLSELKKKRQQLQQADISSNFTIPINTASSNFTIPIDTASRNFTIPINTARNVTRPKNIISSSPAPVRLRRIRAGEETKPVPNDDSKASLGRPSPSDSGLGSDSTSRRSSNSTTSLDDAEQTSAVILATTSTQHLSIPIFDIQKSTETADLVIELDASDIEDSPALIKMSASPAVNGTITSTAVHKSIIDTMIVVEKSPTPRVPTPTPTPPTLPTLPPPLVPVANETSEKLVVSRKRSAPSEWDTDSEGSHFVGRRRGRRGGRNRPKGDHYVPIEERVDHYEPPKPRRDDPNPPEKIIDHYEPPKPRRDDPNPPEKIIDHYEPPKPRRDDPNPPEKIIDHYKPSTKNDRVDHYEPRPRKEPLRSQEEMFDKRARKPPLLSQEELLEKAGIEPRKREWERKRDKEREWERDRERRVSRGRREDERMDLEKGSIGASGKETWEASSYVPQQSVAGSSIEDVVVVRPLPMQRRGWGDSSEPQSHLSQSHSSQSHSSQSHSSSTALHPLDTYRIGFEDINERRRENDIVMVQVDKYLQKSLARMVVNVMDGLYDNRVISDRDAFKDMARTITESFMRDLRSLASLSSPRSPLESELGSNGLVETYTRSMLAKMIGNT